VNTESSPTPPSAADNSWRRGWTRLARTSEGRILLAGVVLAIAGLMTMAAVAFWSRDMSHMIGIMTLFNVLFGRAVSMSIGYAGGLDHAVVVPVNIWIETVLVLLFYPLFVFSMHRLLVVPALKRHLDRAHRAAERHSDKVRRYGTIGLFVFVWFPFWMTGPVIGSAIGYLLGFPAWLTLSVVLVGTYLAMAGWAYLMFDLHSRAAEIGSWGPLLMIALLIAIVIAGQWLSRRNRQVAPQSGPGTLHENGDSTQPTASDTDKP
jgi:uncharacterized membrane protein